MHCCSKLQRMQIGCMDVNELHFVLCDCVTLSADVVVRPMLIESPPHSVEQKVESAVSLSCAAAGSPRPAVQWYRNAELVNNTDRSAQDLYLCVRLFIMLYICIHGHYYQQDCLQGKLLVTCLLVGQLLPRDIMNFHLIFIFCYSPMCHVF